MDRDGALDAAEVLRRGCVIVYPTETVYGIGCDPWNREAVERIFRIKQRAGERTMLLLADSREMVEREFGILTGAAARLAEKFWPGPLTMIVRPARICPKYLLGPTGGVAVRVTSDMFCLGLIGKFGRPVVSTSANVSGEAPVSSYEEARKRFESEADLVIKGGDMTGIPSTIVDMTSGSPLTIREGAISNSRIVEVLRS